MYVIRKTGIQQRSDPWRLTGRIVKFGTDFIYIVNVFDVISYSIKEFNDTCYVDVAYLICDELRGLPIRISFGTIKYDGFSWEGVIRDNRTGITPKYGIYPYLYLNEGKRR